MKILLLGRNGQVGWELQRSLAPLGEVIALDRGSENYCGDLSDLDGLQRTISHIRPNVIVNAAAYTAVDRAEVEVAAAQQINAHAPGCIAEAAKAINALLVHYSTDYVFAGTGESAWQEYDDTAPKNAYGRSKLAGEKAITESQCNYMIFRTSWVYGAHGHNFLKTILALATSRSELKVINDQHGAPTGAELIADVTAHCIRHFTPEKKGIYHLVSSGVTNWHEYAQYLLSVARNAGVSLSIQPESILAVNSDEFKVAAKRPFNSRLNNRKICDTFNVELPDWTLGVERTLIEVLESKINAKA
jgi:dTDP-4-dehydrorhamnose reductase